MSGSHFHIWDCQWNIRLDTWNDIDGNDAHQPEVWLGGGELGELERDLLQLLALYAPPVAQS